jgi:hypothetical protein
MNKTFGYRQVGGFSAQANGITLFTQPAALVVAGTDRVFSRIPEGSLIVHGCESHAEVTDLTQFGQCIASALAGQKVEMPCTGGLYAGPDTKLRIAEWNSKIYIYGVGGDWDVLSANEEEPTAILTKEEAGQLLELITAS